ncbi:lipid-A-disaccharide synthase N-terminal domain-containing protein [Oleiagrimonas sp. C23AA]|uniref:lipid-A-disaccharide synthase N-terminal domain-containing protein n=1 Tax=Oleiagrimonas sp. C23AA TaxID=2719047 RepID=UPI001420959E|nr:lipid-A-disaccharide synthase N-terminal domain-containing protein [Oleiagrimonas sp. C23AA]NII11103.1 hypothetical protein [Oleiagrimonas sp. C23AA]
MPTASTWLILGIFGQVLFSMRFLVQWIYSELKRQCIFPMAFWYLSIAGGMALLAYAIYRRDPVFIVGQAGGLIIYARNLQWRIREKRDAMASATNEKSSDKPAITCDTRP